MKKEVIAKISPIDNTIYSTKNIISNNINNIFSYDKLVDIVEVVQICNKSVNILNDVKRVVLDIHKLFKCDTEIELEYYCEVLNSEVSYRKSLGFWKRLFTEDKRRKIMEKIKQVNNSIEELDNWRLNKLRDIKEIELLWDSSSMEFPQCETDIKILISKLKSKRAEHSDTQVDKQILWLEKIKY